MSDQNNHSVVSGETLVVLLLDASGSMLSVWDQTIEAVNTYLEQLRQDDTPARVTLNVFDSEGGWGSDSRTRCKTVFADVPLQETPEITKEHYQPHGGTPLYDSIGITVSQIDDALARAETPPNVVFAIMTDGINNASKEHSQASIETLLNMKQETGWTVTYLGANQDAWVVGQSLGIAAGNTKSYDTANIGATMSGLALATNTYRGQAAAFAAKGERFATRSFYKDAGLDEDQDKESDAA